MARYKTKKRKKRVTPVQPIKKTNKSQVIVEETVAKKHFNLTENQYRTLALIPILLIVAIVPLILYAKAITLTPIEKINWTGGSFHVDFFSWYKSIVFIILTFISFVASILLIVMKKIAYRKSRIFYIMGVYLFFVILSTIFATDKTIALRGFVDMHQGVFVLISYMLLMFTLYQLVNTKRHLMMILGSLIFVGVAIGLIGYYQYIGKDLLHSEFVVSIILPKSLLPLKDSIRGTFGQFQVYATMGNTNFVGSFAALMIPLSFALYFYSNKLIFKLFLFVFAALMIFVAFGSNSRAGIIGIGSSLVLVILLFRKEFIVKPVLSLLPFITMALLALMLNVITEGLVVKELQSMNLISEIRNAQLENEDKFRFERFETYGHQLLIETNQDGIIIEKKMSDVILYDLNNEILPLKTNGLVITIDQVGYENYRIDMDASKSFFILRAYGRSYVVYHTMDGLKLLGFGGQLVDAKPIERLNFLDGYENLFSKRVYIWSHSIPLLKNTILVGDGPDMYPISFNQNDFVGKSNQYMQDVIVDKPHNMYIQIGINTGIISLLAMISLFAIYLYRSLRLYISGRFSGLLNYVGAGVFLSILAYLITGIFNDQVISVAPLFYTLLGLGFVINLMNEQIQFDFKTISDNKF